MPTARANRRVVVTGYGMVTPLGPDVATTFERAAAGESGIARITSFDTSGLPCQIGGEVRDEWLNDVSTPRAGRAMTRGLRMMLRATAEATAGAHLADVAERDRIACVLGSHGANPGIDEIVHLHRFTDGAGRWDARALWNAGGYDAQQLFRRKPDVAATLLAAHADCRGPTLSIASACAAGAQAIGEAWRLIRDGCADLALAGGCEATVDFIGLLGFILVRAVAEHNERPNSVSRPFDRKRCGCVLSEGAAALVLEELGHAERRGVPILGEIRGYGDSADAYRITDPHPQGLGAVLAMRMALAEAGLSPTDVEYINAHGTSTPQGDLAEARAIHTLFGERASTLPVSANKSMLGHTIAAAGAIECALTLVGMRNSLLLPTINHEHPDPRCDLDVVPNVARKQPHRVALSNSFGFGGQNACLCLGRWDA